MLRLIVMFIGGLMGAAVMAAPFLLAHQVYLPAIEVGKEGMCFFVAVSVLFTLIGGVGGACCADDAVRRTDAIRHNKRVARANEEASIRKQRFELRDNREEREQELELKRQRFEHLTRWQEGFGPDVPFPAAYDGPADDEEEEENDDEAEAMDNVATTLDAEAEEQKRKIERRKKAIESIEQRKKAAEAVGDTLFRTRHVITKKVTKPVDTATREEVAAMKKELLEAIREGKTVHVEPTQPPEGVERIPTVFPVSNVLTKMQDRVEELSKRLEEICQQQAREAS